jgi:hypothetical protein
VLRFSDTSIQKKLRHDRRHAQGLAELFHGVAIVRQELPNLGDYIHESIPWPSEGPRRAVHNYSGKKNYFT